MVLPEKISRQFAQCIYCLVALHGKQYNRFSFLIRKQKSTQEIFQELLTRTKFQSDKIQINQSFDWMSFEHNYREENIVFDWLMKINWTRHFWKKKQRIYCLKRTWSSPNGCCWIKIRRIFHSISKNDGEEIDDFEFLNKFLFNLLVLPCFFRDLFHLLKEMFQRITTRSFSSPSSIFEFEICSSLVDDMW